LYNYGKILINTDSHLYYVKNSNSYFTDNSFCLNYMDKPINAVYRIIFYCNNHKDTLKHIMWNNSEFLIVTADCMLYILGFKGG
jgi:hypothetical protein